MKRLSAIAIILTMICATGFSQKIKLVSGNLSKLKDQKILNLEYEYNDLLVGKKKESVYIQETVVKYNDDEPGKGDTWKTAWVNNRETRYQPKFEELLNKHLTELGMEAKPNAEGATYTIVLKTIMIDPGFNIGVTRKPAIINVLISIVESNNKKNSVAEILMTKVPGQDAMGFDYDSGLRIAEAYAKCGKSLAKYIGKSISK